MVGSPSLLCTSQEPLRTHPCCLTGGQVVARSNPVSPTDITAGQRRFFGEVRDRLDGILMARYPNAYPNQNPVRQGVTAGPARRPRGRTTTGTTSVEAHEISRPGIINPHVTQSALRRIRGDRRRRAHWHLEPGWPLHTQLHGLCRDLLARH